MLKPLSELDAPRVHALFEEAGYTNENLNQHLSPADLPSSRLRNSARLLDRTSAPSCLNSLLRWFWIGIPQTADDVGDTVPGWFVAAAVESGMLGESGDQLVPQIMLLPTLGKLIASDHTSRMDAADAGLVLWPNPTTKLLARLTVPVQSRSTLDIGTGTGVLSLVAAARSEHVVATDLNPRALLFAAFNARLNGVSNLELIAGDAFEPVHGRSFDLIVSNPPFFITPSTSYLFCDNSMELDGLCAKLAKSAPAHLNEGGYYQMLCEWAEIRGEGWKERLAKWFEGSGCDVWVMLGASQNPEKYALNRIRETNAQSGSDASMFASYMAYYRERDVEMIHDGLIIMRRRAGRNWIRMDPFTRTAGDALGELILQAFAARDFLEQANSDEMMLSIQPRLSPDVRLEQVCERANGRWHATSLNLHLTRGFVKPLAVQPLVAEFLATCDGRTPTEVLIADLAAKAGAPLEVVRSECLKMLRSLIDQGFMLIDSLSVTSGDAIQAEERG